jgi:hypothetical protein
MHVRPIRLKKQIQSDCYCRCRCGLTVSALSASKQPRPKRNLPVPVTTNTKAPRIRREMTEHEMDATKKRTEEEERACEKNKSAFLASLQGAEALISISRQAQALEILPYRGRGQRGKDSKPRAKRRCQRCKECDGPNVTTCRGGNGGSKGGATACQYFDENRETRT